MAPDAENRENLPPNYYERQIAGKDEDWVKVYVHGDYGFVRDGKPVYPEYKDGLHCKEFELLPGVPIHIGIDFPNSERRTLNACIPQRWVWCERTAEYDSGRDTQADFRVSTRPLLIQIVNNTPNPIQRGMLTR